MINPSSFALCPNTIHSITSLDDRPVGRQSDD
jgi:hypothetical protein